MTAAATHPGSQGSTRREGFLDVIRSVALVRVVAWHATGAAALTWFAAMPVMFFVTGSLLARSFDRATGGPVGVVLGRLRRIWPPLVVFAATAWTVMAVVARRSGAPLPIHRAALWVVPIADPHGTAWEGGWLSSHLWYLRALLWLFLAAPLLRRAAARRPAATLAAGVVAVLALDALARHTNAASSFQWALGDAALYGTFLVVGFVHRDGRFADVTRRTWLAAAGSAALAAVAWQLTRPVTGGVVNDSHALELLVGTAWLSLALAFRPHVERLARAPVVHAVNRRSLTVYLWHTAVIAVAAIALGHVGITGGPLRLFGLVVLVPAGIAAVCTAVGWVEDVAAGRQTVAPLRRKATAVLAAVTTGAGLLALGPTAAGATSRLGAGSLRLPVPSQQPPAPTFTAGPTTRAAAAPATLDRALATWVHDNQLDGAIAAVSVSGRHTWSGATGTGRSTDDHIEAASITKLLTADLVYRAADAGLVDLDAPLPRVAALPDFPYDAGITVADLLDHRSGLVNYRDTPGYETAPERIDDPVAAIEASAARPLRFAPGTAYNYSSTNYLVLGLLLEQVTGRSYDDLLRTQLLDPLGTTHTVHHRGSAGEPNGATSGIETDLTDLLRIGDGILRARGGLSASSFARLTDVDPASGAGAGTFGFCPCRIDADGHKTFFAIGHMGATTLLVYAPSIDATIAVDLSLPLDGTHGVDSVSDLFTQIGDLFGSFESILGRPA